MNDKINQFDSNIDGLFTVNDLKVCLFTLVCRRRSFICPYTQGLAITAKRPKYVL